MAGLSISRSELSRLTMLMSAAILLFYSGILVSSSIGFYAGQPISIINLLFGLGLTVTFYFVVGRRISHLGWAKLSVGLGLIVGVVIVTMLTGTLIYDLASDGRIYHQTAVMQLEAGWNPIQTELDTQGNFVVNFLNHSPRGPWIAAANIYHLVDDIEASKVFTSLMMAAVFLATLAFFLNWSKTKIWEAVLLALLTACNPVIVTQLFTYYIDGQVAAIYTLILIFTVACIFWPDLPNLVGLAAAIVLAFNIKFTATAYTFLLLAFLLLLGLWRRRSWRWTLSVGAAVVSGVIIGLLVVGYNPYVTNFVRNGHPFYPFYGNEHFNNLVQDEMPLNFEDASWGKKMFISTFSPSQNTIGHDTSPLKLPFTFTIDEIKQLGASDVRVAGFGVLFSGALLAALVGLGFLLATDRRTGLIVLSMIGLIFLTMLINPEAWWVRYAPQFWLAPISVAGGCLISKANRRITWSGRVLMFILLVNVVLVAGAYLAYNLRNTWRMKNVLDQLAQYPGVVLVHYGPYRATELKLDEAGIKYQVVYTLDELPCKQLLGPAVYYSLPECPVEP